jgi:hypothetical protein
MKICSYCKSRNISCEGHIISECYVLKNTECIRCNQLGHTVKYCPIQLCRFCQKIGLNTNHSIKDCFLLNNIYCHKCNHKGHTKKYCKKDISNNQPPLLFSYDRLDFFQCIPKFQ